jgi:hypothetical protein
MGIKVTLEGANCVSEGVWLAKLSPGSAAVFGEPAARRGAWTVVAVEGMPSYDKGAGSLTFDPSKAQLLNVGATERLLVLGGDSETHTSEPDPRDFGESARPAPTRHGDREFLEALPQNLRDLGKALLSEVRHHFKGELRYYPDSRRFVEKPDNFWTVTIRTRVSSLDITVRGTPEFFGPMRQVEVKPDRGSYSRFKVTSLSQVGDAVSVIRRAASYGRRGAV